MVHEKHLAWTEEQNLQLIKGKWNNKNAASVIASIREMKVTELNVALNHNSKILK